MASRSLGYGRSASIAVCTTAMTSPPSAPIMVKPRIRSSLPATRAFMNPCVSSVVSVRRTALVGTLGTRLGRPVRSMPLSRVAAGPRHAPRCSCSICRSWVRSKAALGAVYLLSWAAFVPGNDQSAGKRRSTRVRYGVRPRAARRRAPPRPRPRALRPSCATADPCREIDARHAAQRSPNRLPLAVGTACAIPFFRVA